MVSVSYAQKVMLFGTISGLTGFGAFACEVATAGDTTAWVTGGPFFTDEGRVGTVIEIFAFGCRAA